MKEHHMFRNGLAVFAAFVLAATPASAGRWDGAFIRKGAVTSAGSSQNIAVPKASYVKVTCSGDAYVGQGEGSGTSCSTTTCDLIKYSLGEKFFVQLNGAQNYIAVYAATSTTCQVFYNMQ